MFLAPVRPVLVSISTLRPSNSINTLSVKSNRPRFSFYSQTLVAVACLLKYKTSEQLSDWMIRSATRLTHHSTLHTNHLPTGTPAVSSLQERLQNLTPRIEKILSLSSTPGASVGIVSRGELVFKGNYGFRDHALSKAPGSDTSYNIGSLTKSMLAAAAEVQISRGKLHWNTLVSDILPEFKTSDRNASDSCKIIDLLAHKTGLPTVNVLWYQGGSKPLSREMICFR